MTEQLVLRVMSNAGRSRIEMATTATVAELKQEVAGRLGLDPKTIKIFMDQAFKKAMPGKDTETLQKAGLKGGDMLHINNADAQIANIVTAPKFKSHEEIKTEQEEKAKNAPLVDSSGRAIKAVADKKETAVATDSYGRVIKQAAKEEKPKEVKMINDKKLGDDTGDQFVKHQSFENFLIEKKKKCRDKHLPH